MRRGFCVGVHPSIICPTQADWRGSVLLLVRPRSSGESNATGTPQLLADTTNPPCSRMPGRPWWCCCPRRKHIGMDAVVPHSPQSTPFSGGLTAPPSPTGAGPSLDLDASRSGAGSTLHFDASTRGAGGGEGKGPKASHSAELLGHIRGFLAHNEEITRCWRAIGTGRIESLPDIHEPLVQQKNLEGEVRWGRPLNCG
jgi:hypothetical protein